MHGKREEEEEEGEGGGGWQRATTQPETGVCALSRRRQNYALFLVLDVYLRRFPEREKAQRSHQLQRTQPESIVSGTAGPSLHSRLSRIKSPPLREQLRTTTSADAALAYSDRLSVTHGRTGQTGKPTWL